MSRRYVHNFARHQREDAHHDDQRERFGILCIAGLTLSASKVRWGCTVALGRSGHVFGSHAIVQFLVWERLRLLCGMKVL